MVNRAIATPFIYFPTIPVGIETQQIRWIDGHQKEKPVGTGVSDRPTFGFSRGSNTILLNIRRIPLSMTEKPETMEPVEWARFVLRNRTADKYSDAFSILARFAREGDPDAMCSLGLMYARGQGVSKDYDAAASWFVRAHEQHHTGATYFLGKMHATGVGLSKDSNKAKSYFEECSGVDVRAQYELGILYFNDDQIRHDYVKSAEWMEKAAKNGHAEAQFMLGQFYKNGVGVDKDADEAVRWLTAAALNRHTGAQILLGNMYRLGDGVIADRNESDKWYDMADGKTNVH